MSKDPESLGRGIGPLLADFVPLLPSGARRAGAAKVMAARTGDDPSFLVDHPIKTQLLAMGLGGAGAALTQGQGRGVQLGAALGPIALVQLLRHLELKKIQRSYDEKKRKRLRELDQEDLFDNGALGWGGSARLGAVNAYETMRKRKYQGFGSLAEAGDAVQLAANAVHPLGGAAIIPVLSGIDNREADKILKAASIDFEQARDSMGRVAGSTLGGGVMGALGTSGFLGLAALLARKPVPALSPILRDAAKDGLLVFNPRRSMRLAKAMPEGLALFKRERAGLTAAEKILASGKTPGMSTVKGIGKDVGADTLQKDLARFKSKHGMSPFELTQALAGSISGVASAGAGAVVGGLSTGGAEAKKIYGRRKNPLWKQADFSDQRNSPSLPLYLAAAALSSAGLTGARHWANREGDNTPTLGPRKWRGMVGDISGTAPLLLGTEGADNAFFYKPRTELDAERFLNSTQGLADHTGTLPMESILATKRNKIQRLLRHGAIVADNDTGAPTIAHEAGHAKIEETPGVLRFLQRHLYPHSRWVAPMAGAGSMAAGLASGSALKGALLGTGIGSLANIGMIAPETGASYHALKHLHGLGDGKLSAEGRKDLASALSTYLAFNVLPSTLAGAAGGWISGRRKKKEDEEQEKEASADKIHALWKALRRAKTLKRDLGPDSADRYLMDQVGSVYRAANNRFFRNPQVSALGITPRSRPGTIDKLLKQLQDPPAPAAPPAQLPAPSPPKKVVQETFDFFKEGAHPDLPDLKQAKQHSDDEDYRRKNILLRTMMQADPGAWIVDSDDGKGIVGLTHTPTNFRIHMPKDRVYHEVLLRAQPPAAAA